MPAILRRLRLQLGALTGYNVINISTGKETALNSLLEAFKSACGHELTVNYAPARNGRYFRSVLSNKKLEASAWLCTAN